MSRLYTRIYLHLLAVLAVVGVATTLVFALGAPGPFVREAVDRMASHVASLLSEQLSNQDGLSRRLRQLNEDLEADLTVRAMDGRLLARAGAELPELRPEDLARVARGDLVFRRGRAWLVVAPIRDPASGTVVAILQASSQRAFHHANILRPLLAVGLLLGLVAAATAPLARRISRPVEHLTEAARRLGGGDLGARVPRPAGPRRWGRRPGRGDEIAELTLTFNEMAERLERLVMGQKELLANISHELRSPLARIRVALELLPRSTETEARVRDLETDLAELERLIDDALTASRLDATGLPPHPAPVDVGSLLAGIAERARQDPRLASAQVEEAPVDRVEIVGDAALLRRALWNLVDNAIKYGAPPITLSAERTEAGVRLSVSDCGPGIAPAERQRVLEPFYRVDKARTPGAPGETARGFGLGLALARRIAEVHHGSIAIGPASIVDGQERGCRVVITLPADITGYGHGSSLRAN